MLFSHQRSHTLTIPAADKGGRASTIAYLIDYLCDHVMDDSRKDLFVLDNHLYVLAPFTPPPCDLRPATL